jgi:hypothetical protein
VLPPDWSKVENQKVSDSKAVNGDSSAGGKELEA